MGENQKKSSNEEAKASGSINGKVKGIHNHSSEKSSEANKDEAVCRLPHDIISDILSRLSIEDIFRYKIVSKDWNARTKDPLFIEMQLQRSLAQPQRLLLEPKASNFGSISSIIASSVSRLCLVDTKGGVWKGREIPIRNMQGNFAFTIASCHGLLCVASSSYEPDPFFIYNPITRESLKLPDTVAGQSWMGSLSVGFGYDPINRKYKVVRIFRCYRDDSVKGEIITLGEASWRELKVSHSVICKYPAKGVFLDDAIHWMIDNEDDQIVGILVLDISSEKFRTIKIPLSISGSIKDQDDVVLLNLGGSLSLVEHRLWEQFCVWRMARANTKTGYKFYKSSYKMSLNKANILSLKLMDRMVDDSFLFHVSSTKGRKDYLSMYYPEQDRYRIIEAAGIPKYYDPNLYTPSLVSPISASRNSDKARGARSDCSYEKSREADKDEAVCRLTPVIISDILSRLSIEDIVRYKIVSKDWNARTKDPHFIEMHLQRSLAQPQRFLLEPKSNSCDCISTAVFLSRLCLVDSKDGVWKGREIPIQNMQGNFGFTMGSCHGLLCVASPYGPDPFFICNPITRESLKLPDTLVGQSWRGSLTVGFGYDPINRKYKIVRLFSCYWDDSVTGEIITLGEASWRELEVSHSVIVRYPSKGVFLDDTIHWMIDNEDGQLVGILVLDIVSEKFRTIKIPLSIRRSIEDQDDVVLLNLGGSLSLVKHNQWGQCCVWRMARADTKNGYKFYESSYQMSLNMPEIWSMKMITRMIDNSFLFHVSSTNGGKDHLSMYYPEQDRHRIIEGVGFPTYYDADLYTPTFVSPFAACGISGQIRGPN